MRERPEITDTSTPVLLLGCQLGGLAILRSLGPYGIDLHAIEEDSDSIALRSKYCKAYTIKRLNREQPGEYLELVQRIGKNLGRKAVLIPTSDPLSMFVAENRHVLSEQFLFPNNDAALVRGLADKREMYRIALETKTPTPVTLFPQNLEDVKAALPELTFPVMLKAIFGDRMERRTGERMLIVESADDLLEKYQIHEDPEIPNIMLQEFIPGGDDQVYIFNGYFDQQSRCLAAFTGHKIRQFPIHRGCASLGECRTYPEVKEQTIRLMQAVGYRGILDIGYRLDPRDGKYKVLDINPRVGQAMRIFVSDSGMDVVRALYLDLTGQPVPESAPIEGRRWVIEDFDLVSTLHYFQEGTLDIGEWLRSYRSVQETAYLSVSDPTPSLVFAQRFAKKFAKWSMRSMRGQRPNA